VFSFEQKKNKKKEYSGLWIKSRRSGAGERLSISCCIRIGAAFI
jgi:hypothetical protein